jgi:hypothetical protein
VNSIERVRLDDLGHESLALVDVLLQFGEASLKKFLLGGRQVTEAVNGFNTVEPKLNETGEEIYALGGEERTLDKGGGDDTLFAIQGSEERVRELGTSVSHGEGGRSSTILGLYDLVTTELNAVNELVVGFALHTLPVLSLGKERNDGGTTVTTDNGNNGLVRFSAGNARKESSGSHDIKGGDTEQALGVENTCFRKSLCHDGDGGVDGVGNDQDVGCGCGLRDVSGQVPNDGRICVEKIISGHARLPGNTGGNYNDFDAFQSGMQLVSLVAYDVTRSIDMANIGSNTRCTANIIETQSSD